MKNQNLTKLCELLQLQKFIYFTTYPQHLLVLSFNPLVLKYGVTRRHIDTDLRKYKIWLPYNPTEDDTSLL